MKKGFFLFADFASHMHMLTSAFHKENIEHLGCQILLACEAGDDESKEGKRSRIELKSKIGKVLR